jgi:hypothetical protein
MKKIRSKKSCDTVPLNRDEFSSFPAGFRMNFFSRREDLNYISETNKGDYPCFLLANLGKHVPSTQGVERPRERGGIVAVLADGSGGGRKPK